MTAYTELLDLNANPSNPRLYAGDYLTSPNGVYYGILQDNGQFVVNHGTNPVMSAGSTSAWSTSAARSENQQFEAALSGGDFGVLGSYAGIIY